MSVQLYEKNDKRTYKQTVSSSSVLYIVIFTSFIDTMAAVRASLRSILRSVGSKTTRGANVIQRFRESSNIQDEKELNKMKHMAADYAEMLAATREKNRLIILDSGAERLLDGKELVRRSARRVGLNMHDD